MKAEWVMVIITAVYVIATIVICIFNGKSAKAAKEQTKEMKLQFLSVNRPIITVEIVYIKRLFWAIRFKNNGNNSAYNTTIEFNQDFIDSLPEPDFRKMIEDDKGKVRTIGAGQHYDLYIGSNKYRKADNKPPIEGKVIYNGINGSIFVEEFKIEVQNYATFYSVNSDLDDIKKLMKTQSKELKNIANQIANINSNKK